MSLDCDIKMHPSDQECSICLQPFKSQIKLSCGHAFDYLCIADWWRKSSQEDSWEAKCPIDRKIFSFEDVRNSFRQLQIYGEFTKLMENYDRYHLGSEMSKLSKKEASEVEIKRKEAYLKVDEFVKQHPELMDFLPIYWF